MTEDSNTVNFVGDRGEKTSGYNTVTCDTGMQIGQSALVNSGPPEDSIVANDGAAVYEITLQEIAGIYDYQIRVKAKGPKGAFSGSMYLAFEDMTGDIYYLSIYSSSLEWHEVSFNSHSPEIVKIFWSDESFSVSHSKEKQEKPKYTVVSPVPA